MDHSVKSNSSHIHELDPTKNFTLRRLTGARSGPSLLDHGAVSREKRRQATSTAFTSVGEPTSRWQLISESGKDLWKNVFKNLRLMVYLT